MFSKGDKTKVTKAPTFTTTQTVYTPAMPIPTCVKPSKKYEMCGLKCCGSTSCVESGLHSYKNSREAPVYTSAQPNVTTQPGLLASDGQEVRGVLTQPLRQERVRGVRVVFLQALVRNTRYNLWWAFRAKSCERKILTLRTRFQSDRAASYYYIPKPGRW